MVASLSSLLLFAAIVFGPPYVIAVVMKRLGRSRWWALLWLVALAALYAYVVYNYDRI